MDLNQKTLVSHGYCTGFVDCRHTNSQTSYHTVCTASYWKSFGGEGGGWQHWRQKVNFAVYCAVDASYV